MYEPTDPGNQASVKRRKVAGSFRTRAKKEVMDGQAPENLGASGLETEMRVENDEAPEDRGAARRAKAESSVMDDRAPEDRGATY